MTVVLYSAIRPVPDQSITSIIRRATTMGYEMTPFAGWSDRDLGYDVLTPGPVVHVGGHRRAEAIENQRMLTEIQNACVVRHPDGDDVPHIVDVCPAGLLDERYVLA